MFAPSSRWDGSWSFGECCFSFRDQEPCSSTTAANATRTARSGMGASSFAMNWCQPSRKHRQIVTSANVLDRSEAHCGGRGRVLSPPPAGQQLNNGPAQSNNAELTTESRSSSQGSNIVSREADSQRMEPDHGATTRTFFCGNAVDVNGLLKPSSKNATQGGGVVEGKGDLGSGAPAGHHQGANKTTDPIATTAHAQCHGCM